MTKYLISFPSSAMVFPEEDFQAVCDESHAVVEEANAAGVAAVAHVAVCPEGMLHPGDSA